MRFLLKFSGSKYCVPPVSKGSLKYASEQMHQVVSVVYWTVMCHSDIDGFSRNLWATSRPYATCLDKPASSLETSKNGVKDILVIFSKKISRA